MDAVAVEPPPGPVRWWKRRNVRALLLLAILAGLLAGAWDCMIRMPGRSWSGPLPAMSPADRAIAESLRRDVETLAGRIGNRNVHAHSKLAEAAAYIESRMTDAGLAPARQTFEVQLGPCHNIEAEIRGSRRPDEIVLVGAHYDSVFGCPGANDNATCVAAMLALATAFSGRPAARTLRFVAFVNEEPPYFRTSEMGSRVYARRCRERGEKIVAMLSLETLGYYSDEEGSQRYPFPVGLFYPSTGNFAGFVGNVGSRVLVRRVVGSFRRHASFPSEGAALPGWLPGIGWSDHESFWEEGYPAVMVTDTAPFRYPHYHSVKDTPDKIDYERCARVVSGLKPVVAELAGDGE